MKKNLKFILIAAAALSFAACTPDNPDPVTPDKPGEEEPKEDEKVELNQALEFTLELKSIEAEVAVISISHNGEAKDTWYGFYTEEVNGDDLSLIETEIKTLLKDGKVSGLKKQQSTTVTLRGLTSDTEYKYIAFGLSEDGEFYGTPKSLKFQTPRDASKMEQTNDWQITYQRGENQGQTAEIFTIKCDAGHGYYFTTIDKYSLKAEGMTNKDYAVYVANEEIPLYLSYGYTWDELYIPEAYTLATPRMNSGEYVAFAIGFDAKGKATGFFSAQEFTVVEEAASAEYNQWLGNWEITSTYQYEDETTGEIVSAEVTYGVTLHHYDNNFMYAMTGWEENSDNAYGISNDIRDYVGEYAIPVYYDNGNLQFQETTLDYINFSDYGNYYFGFYGIGNLTGNGQNIESTLIAIDSMPMATATTEDGGQTGVIQGLNQKYGSHNIEYIGMFYCGYPDAESGSLAYWNNPMYFPMTMVKAPEGRSQKSVALPVSIKAQTVKKIQKKDLTPMILQ